MAEHQDLQAPPERLGDVDHHLAYLKLSLIAEQYAALAKHAAQLLIDTINGFLPTFGDV
jgi:hypothetical protein